MIDHVTWTIYSYLALLIQLTDAISIFTEYEMKYTSCCILYNLFEQVHTCTTLVLIAWD